MAVHPGLKLPVYMDYHATTPVDPRVLESMLPFFTDRFGNAASRQHAFGWEAEEAVEKARRQVAGLIGATAKEIVFTSGATESDNLAIKGVAAMYRGKGNHIITAATEHKAVLDPCRRLEKEGCRVTWLPVQQDGRIRLDVNEAAVDLASLSAHKMYGPKGVGALYVRRRNPRVLLAPIIDGGGHERGLRSGTLNVPGIAGFGRAAELCGLEMAAEGARLRQLRDRLNERLHAGLDDIRVNGSMEHRLPHNLNVSFAYVEGEALLMGINDVAVSSGSACTSASREPSHVLKALGAGDDLAHSSIRFGLGRWTTEEEVDYVADKITQVVTRLRDMSPFHEHAREGVDLSMLEWRRD